MNRIKKKLAGLLVLTFILGMLAGMAPVQTVRAEKVIPKFSLKVAKDDTAVTVTIQPMQDAEGYYIYMKSGGDPDFKKVKELKKDGTVSRSVTITGLIRGGKYTFMVKAYAHRFEVEYRSNESEKKSITLALNKAKTGDTVIFGSYYYDYDGKEKKPIEWIVLSNNGKELFVLSKYGLDTQPYNDKDTVEDLTWEKCTLRKWLNNEFYNAAFSKAEKKLIKRTTIKNEDTPSQWIKKSWEGGKDTKDRVFLLSVQEVTNKEYGFKSKFDNADIARRCAVTPYARAQNGDWCSYGKKDGNGKAYKTAEGRDDVCNWYLRSSGEYYDKRKCAAAVSDTGKVDCDGFPVAKRLRKGNHYPAIRPAIKINLKP